MSLAQKAGKAGALLLFRKMWGALVNIGVMAYLARTLDKSDFGLVAISGTLIGFIEVLGVAGIGEYLIFYNEKNKEKVINSAFWLNLFLTGFISIVILSIAPFWARFYNDKKIFNIVIFLLVGFFFSMLSAVPQAIFRKDMNYQPLIAIQTIFGTISQISQASFAFLGFGVYSLVLPNAIITPLLVYFIFKKSGFRPQIRTIGRKYWKQIFSYTKHVIGARFLTKFVNEGDTILIGKLIGLEALGIYDIAFKLANIFNQNLLPIISNISLPVFAKTSANIREIQSRYLKMVSFVAFIFFPVMGIMIAVAPSIIFTIYGSNWGASIIPFQILSIFAAFRAISSPSSGLFNALNKPQISFYFNLIFAPVFLLSLIFGTSKGLIFTCVVVTIVRILGGIVLLHLSSKLIELTLSEIYKKLFSSLLISFFLTLIAFIIGLHQASILFIIIFGIIYIILYLTIHTIITSEGLISFLNIISSINPSIGNFVSKIIKYGAR